MGLLPTLTDIIKIVPGFDVIIHGAFGNTEFGARGISSSSSKIKVLFDGHSLNDPLFISVAEYFDEIPLTNVDKIEIIRGPGSAIYGANAFLAVINIITKKAHKIDGIKVSSGFGSYDTQEYSFLYGKTLYGIDISGFANFYNTNGLSETIKADALSEQPFFRQFSLTPGDTDNSKNRLDLDLKLSYKDIELKAKYMNRDQEPFTGPAFVLTNEAAQSFNYVMGDLSYKYDLGEKASFFSRVYYDQYDIDLLADVMPPGFSIPFDLDDDSDIESFPDGLFANFIATTRRLGGEIQSNYDLLDNNVLTLGFSYEWERLDNVNHFTNSNPLTGASVDSVQDFTDTANWIQESTRQIWAIYIQDKWDITDDLGLTIGIRHDHYSDFEGTTNPRIGLVWNFLDNATLKLLYGQAFRAPNFQELYNINNTVLLGNPDLKPETIRTYEVGLGYNFTNRLNTNVNYFFNVIRDEIGIAPVSSSGDIPVHDNIGGSNIQGIEFEAKLSLGNLWKDAYVFANYTYQDSESRGDPVPDVPKHKGNVGFNVGLTKYLNANIHAFISDERVRAEQDTRDDSPGYAIVNLTLIAKEFFKKMKVKASLFNLLDKDYNDPAPINTIPTDLPRPGRTFFIGLEYGF